jgi:hypothetical protein
MWDDSPPMGDWRDEIIWMPEGDMERVGKVAYAYININGPTDSPTPYIRSALFSVAPIVHFRPFSSSRGHMLLRFDSRGDRDAVAALSPSFMTAPASP